MKRREALLLLAGLAGLRRASAAELPLLSEQDPGAKQRQYVADAAHSADPSHTCATCGLYQGIADAAEGPCPLFPGHRVKAAGTCKDWIPQM